MRYEIPFGGPSVLQRVARCRSGAARMRQQCHPRGYPTCAQPGRISVAGCPIWYAGGAIQSRLANTTDCYPGDEEPTLGAHLVTPRLAFAHHGIYVGAGNVVHYGALASQFRRAPVEEVSLAFFAHGHPLYVRPHTAPRFNCREVIKRARSRLGENRYSLLHNNREHFCEWCVHDVSRSLQVERVLKFPMAFARRIQASYSLICKRGRIFRQSFGVSQLFQADCDT
jgi:hypothetical protein